MSESHFFILFGFVWVIALSYGLSAWRLLARVHHLKSEGRADEAPDPFTNPLAIFGYLAWLLTGRYGEIDDATVRFWAPIARGLFVVAAPLLIAIFVIALTQGDSWSQPT